MIRNIGEFTAPKLADSAFYNAASRIWNKLPADIRQSESLEMVQVQTKNKIFLIITDSFRYGGVVESIFIFDYCECYFRTGLT